MRINIKYIILLFVCVVIWYNNKVVISTKEQVLINSNNRDSIESCWDYDKINNSKNDLVYHEYGYALLLNKGCTCYIYDLVINIVPKGQAYIVIANILTGEEKIIDKYNNQDYMEYTVDEDGVFYFYLSFEEMKYDLTKQVRVSYICNNESKGIINCLV